MALGACIGRFMDGRSASDRAARATIAGAELVITTEAGDGVLGRWPLPELRLDAMHEGDVVHVECPRAPGALLTLTDPLFVSSLRGAGARGRGLLVGRTGVAVGIACFVALGGLFAGAYLGAGPISRAIAARLPIGVEQGLAPHVQSLFARNTCKSREADVALAAMRDRLDPDHVVPAELRIVNLRIANAFALPGGVVLLTRDLLEEAGGPDEVAGVLAHELAHVQHRDALSHMIRNAILGGLWATTLGDYSSFMVVDPKTAYEVATLKFSREAEAAADATALETLTRRGISARGLVEFFERNEAKSGSGAAWLASHPASADRVARLSKQALVTKGPPSLSADAFYRLRNACESTPQVSSIKDLLF